MSGQFFPPQAYTVETVSKAYEWLQAQPESMRNSIKSTDMLVNLYLKTKRMGGTKDSGAASPEAFKSDLKNLAQSLKTFEDEVTPLAHSHSTPPPHPVQQQTIQHQPIRTTMATMSDAPKSAALPPGLDPKTIQILTEVQQAFNLSHPQEALRLLVMLGYERVRSFFPSI